MDPRRQEQKILKKECKRCKRKNIALVRILCLLCLLLAVVAVSLALGMYCIYPFDIQGALSTVGLVGYEWFLAGFFAVLMILFAVAWGQGIARYHRSQEYLSYKTLKTTLHAEEQEVKG